MKGKLSLFLLSMLMFSLLAFAFPIKAQVTEDNKPTFPWEMNSGVGRPYQDIRGFSAGSNETHLIFNVTLEKGPPKADSEHHITIYIAIDVDNKTDSGSDWFLDHSDARYRPAKPGDGPGGGRYYWEYCVCLYQWTTVKNWILSGAATYNMSVTNSTDGRIVTVALDLMSIKDPVTKQIPTNVTLGVVTVEGLGPVVDPEPNNPPYPPSAHIPRDTIGNASFNLYVATWGQWLEVQPSIIGLSTTAGSSASVTDPAGDFFVLPCNDMTKVVTGQVEDFVFINVTFANMTNMGLTGQWWMWSGRWQMAIAIDTDGVPGSGQPWFPVNTGYEGFRDVRIDPAYNDTYWERCIIVDEPSGTGNGHSNHVYLYDKSMTNLGTGGIVATYVPYANKSGMISVKVPKGALALAMPRRLRLTIISGQNWANMIEDIVGTWSYSYAYEPADHLGGCYLVRTSIPLTEEISLLPYGPKACFIYSPPVPTVNCTVTFDASASLPGWNGTADAPIVSYAWDFGDGSPIVAEVYPVVTHTYTAVGSYNVALNVTDSQGLWNTATETITIFLKGLGTDWVKTAVFYQIFPDRFRDGNQNNNARTGDVLWKRWGVNAQSKSWGQSPSGSSDWFGGDLQGVQQKASYLADLGITAIYFNPTMDSTDNHGYTVIDYKSVNRYFGINHRDAGGKLILDYNASLEVFRNMTAALDEYGINVVLDGVFNHCSAKNKWFDVDNDFPTDGAYESQSSPWYNWFVFSNWPDSYKCWWGVRQMPEPEEVDDFKDYIYRASDSVIKFWNDLGVDGWRLDCGPDVSDEFWREFRTYYKGINPEGFILGEAWGDSSRWLQGDQWDSTMNYPFRGAVLDWANGGSVTAFDNSLGNVRSWYSEEVFYTLFNILGSHDITRALRALGDNKAKMKLAVIFQMTYPGVPVVYYGDEVGMTGSGDPDCRRCYPWSDTGGSPDMDMFNHYEKLIGIRKSYPVLSVGTLETRLVDNTKKVYVLARKYNSSVAILIYNNGDATQTVTVDVSDLMADGSILTDVLNNESYTVSGGKVTVKTNGMWANILISGVHDVAVTGITPSDTAVGVGHPVNIDVVVENQGNFTETFSVNLFYGNNAAGTQVVHNLAPRALKTLTFVWDTLGVFPGNYTIKAEVSMVPGETDTADNTYINGIVRVMNVRFTLATLYMVNLYVNETFNYGASLKVRFYTYSGVYQADSTVWNGTTPAHIILPVDVPHPLGLPVEKVSLVLTDNLGNILQTVTSFLVRRTHLFSRITRISMDWPSASSSERITLFSEIIDISKQWPYASS